MHPMALMGAASVCSAISKQHPEQAFGREDDGSWLSMGACSLRDSCKTPHPPHPVDREVTGRQIPSWYKEELSDPTCLDHGMGTLERNKHPVIGSVSVKLSLFLLFATKKYFILF